MGGDVEKLSRVNWNRDFEESCGRYPAHTRMELSDSLPIVKVGFLSIGLAISCVLLMI